jgi:hypothetical protein
MNDRWSWIVRYAVVILAAVILAAAFGEMALFKMTKLGQSGLNGARIVQFLGYGGALALFWLLAQRAAKLLDSHDPRWGTVKLMLVPLATLIVVGFGQAVGLLLLGPVIGKPGLLIYNWIAVIGIIVAAGWLLAVLLVGSRVRRQEHP